jgi:hypothetical protein
MKKYTLIILFLFLAAGECLSTTNFVFIHHSVGENWLEQGGLRTQITSSGFNVHDITYGDDVPGVPVPGMQPNGDFTDIKDWYFWFHNFLDGVLEWECSPGEYNQIVMFKSCFPNSGITEEGVAPGNPTNDNRSMWNYKAAYCSLTNVFAQHSNVLFIAVTAPPMRPGDGYRSDEGARARVFNNWLKKDFVNSYIDSTGLRNVAVFDLFDILATASTKPRGANALSPMYRTRDSHPNVKGSRSATGAFMPYFRNAVNFWISGVNETSAPLKSVKVKIKISGKMLKLKANIDSLDDMPVSADILIKTNLVQHFDNFTSHGKCYISKAVSISGKKATLKIVNKREPVIILKLRDIDIPNGTIPLKVIINSEKVYVVDILTDAKGRFP